MRRSFGIVDRKRILAYKPQLFKRTDDLLVFPAKDFHQWHSEITEYVDGIFQMNAQKNQLALENINLTIALLINIDNELVNLFDIDKEMDFTYQYVSQMDRKYKKRDSQLYGRYMNHIDRKYLEITPQIKRRHLMEIVKYAHWVWAQKDKPTILKVRKK